MNVKIIVLIAVILFFIFKKKMYKPKYFKIEEFNSKDGAVMPFEVKENVLKVIENLDVVRSYINEPIYVNSGYRSLQHNVNVGGVKNSFHMKGLAVDFRTENYSPLQLKEILLKLIKDKKIKEGGIGTYPNFIHYDIRGTKARW